MSGAEIPMPYPEGPAECWFTRELSAAALSSIVMYPEARMCSAQGCELLGKDVKIDYRVGMAILTTQPDTQLREPASGCPSETSVFY